MATQPTTAPAESVKANPAINTVVSAYTGALVKLDIAFDNVRNVSKKETVKHGYTEKQLTALLLDAGLPPARASEVKGFVFPAHSAARKELDKAMEHNAKQTDAKKRIPKEAILALQRDKTGELTVAKAIEAHKAKNTLTRTPGGSTDQTEKGKKKTPEQIEEDLTNLFIAALKFGKENGYDQADCAAVMESAAETVFPDDGDKDDAAGDNDELNEDEATEELLAHVKGGSKGK